MLLLRSIFFTILQPGTVAILIPYWLISSRSHVTPDYQLRYLGLPLIIIGAAGLLWCVWEFFSTGRGTISPVDPPKHLVVQGLYRYVRNPMYVLVIIVLLGEAIFFMSVPVLIEAGVFFALASLFVIFYEEPFLRMRFGESYERYRQAVGRWIPRSPSDATTTDLSDTASASDKLSESLALPIWIIYGLNISERPQFELSREDYLKLWMYFEDRADKVKEAMFKTLTWTIGYAAALLGFIFLNLVNFDESKASVRLHWLMMSAAAAGLAICLYSCFALYESGKHLQRNWDRAKRCAVKFQKLDYIISGAGKGKESGLKIWQQLYVIVLLFALAFIAVIIWALADAKAKPLIPG